MHDDEIFNKLEERKKFSFISSTTTKTKTKKKVSHVLQLMNNQRDYTNMKWTFNFNIYLSFNCLNRNTDYTHTYIYSRLYLIGSKF